MDVAPPMTGDARAEDDRVAAERGRLLKEYQRREQEIPPDRYAPWNPAECFMSEGRRRIAAQLLYQEGVFPAAGSLCLEVGYGRMGWLPTLIGWGVHEADLHGIELDAGRANRARHALPTADLRIGDACSMPWADCTFDLVVASTVFTSILDSTVRQVLAGAIVRVIKPGGALLGTTWHAVILKTAASAGCRERK